MPMSPDGVNGQVATAGKLVTVARQDQTLRQVSYAGSPSALGLVRRRGNTRKTRSGHTYTPVGEVDDDAYGTRTTGEGVLEKHTAEKTYAGEEVPIGSARPV